MKSKPNQLTRRLQLLGMLEGGVGCSVEQLARDFDVSRRTVFRDLNALKKSGVQIRFDMHRSRHRVYIDYGARLPQLTPEEVASMVMAGHLSPLYSTSSLGSQLRQTMAKMVQQLSSPLREQITRLLGHCEFEPPATLPAGVREEIFSVLVNALQQDRAVRIAWQDAKDSTICRSRVIPEKLILTGDHWVLKGRSSYHRKVHRFELAQIVEAELAEELAQYGPHPPK